MTRSKSPVSPNYTYLKVKLTHSRYYLLKSKQPHRDFEDFIVDLQRFSFYCQNGFFRKRLRNSKDLYFTYPPTGQGPPRLESLPPSPTPPRPQNCGPTEKYRTVNHLDKLRRKGGSRKSRGSTQKSGEVQRERRRSVT